MTWQSSGKCSVIRVIIVSTNAVRRLEDLGKALDDLEKVVLDDRCVRGVKVVLHALGALRLLYDLHTVSQKLKASNTSADSTITMTPIRTPDTRLPVRTASRDREFCAGGIYQ